MANSKSRPVFLEPHRLRLPVGAITSILHRISGVLMCVMLPGVIFLLDESLRGQQGFIFVHNLLEITGVKLMVAAGAWALAHHLLAGIRFLIIDLGHSVQRDAARSSAWATNLGGALIALAVTAVLFL